MVNRQRLLGVVIGAGLCLAAVATTAQEVAVPVTEVLLDEPVVADEPLERVGIVAERVSWKRYSFRTDVPSDQLDQFTYLWQFGDGSQSTERIIRHRFKQTGTYEVILTIEDTNRRQLTDGLMVTVSWWHWTNPLMWLLLGIGVIGFIGSAILLHEDWLESFVNQQAERKARQRGEE